MCYNTARDIKPFFGFEVEHMTAKITSLDVDYIVQEYRSGRAANDIARELGIGANTVLRRLHDAGENLRANAFQPRVSIPIDEAIEFFKAGIGVGGIADHYKVSPSAVARIFKANGVKLRNRSEQQAARMARTSPNDRSKAAKAAHDAVRGMKRSEEELAKRALTREARQTHVSAYEKRLAAMLRKRGVDPICQKAIGRYNCDMAVHPVAVEIFGGGWHWTGAHFERTEDRLRYFLDSGWHVLMIHIESRRAPLTAAIADYIVSYVEKVRSDPSTIREYRVVRGAGDLLASGRADDDKLSIIPAFTSARDPITGRYKRAAR